ncbi:mycothiol transferase [Williamsia phyllosphaerae]|uniref:DUF4440 domain-containing protein n=1 Tax=Williamsia phyllosphaerae TaxID=885042 RepID=A0ABQ1V387_9NOCA|nr:DUF664 domain-containing protein [Williamsia phyllosphaerae]GGF34028.1 hypothetical protein GCM10007298_32290 [Williamsia phyllosphaerae]
MQTHTSPNDDDRKIIENRLDVNRRALIDTARGLSDGDARRRLVSSLTTPISLIKHAAAAERIWFQRFWGHFAEAECDGYSRRDEGTFAVDDSETLDDVIAEYERAIQVSRTTAAGFSLDAVLVEPHEGPVSMRWTLLMMIAETARHAGHGDILREQILTPRSPSVQPHLRATDPARIEQEIIAAFGKMRTTILTRNRRELVELHDDEFLGTELPGNVITAEEHIATTMNSRDLEMEFFDIRVKAFGDIALSWARQTLAGHLDPTDPGTSPAVAARVEKEGVHWAMLVVWRHTRGRWRMLSYQVTPITDD